MLTSKLHVEHDGVLPNILQIRDKIEQWFENTRVYVEFSLIIYDQWS